MHRTLSEFHLLVITTFSSTLTIQSLLLYICLQVCLIWSWGYWTSVGSILYFRTESGCLKAAPGLQLEKLQLPTQQQIYLTWFYWALLSTSHIYAWCTTHSSLLLIPLTYGTSTFMLQRTPASLSDVIIFTCSKF